MSKKLFIYTDGSCGPTNPGLTGYGAHMVIGDTEGKTKNIQGKYKLTDEGYLSNVEFKSKKDIGLLALNNGIDLYGFISASDTNNQAELDAVIKSLEFLPILFTNLDNDIDEIIILSDSTYVLGHLEKIINKNFNIKNVNANSEHVKKLDDVVKPLLKEYVVKAQKVKAHEDNIGNNRADMLANMGRRLRHNPKIVDTDTYFNFYIGDKDYWKDPVVDRDMFFCKQLFTFVPHKDNTTTYYGLNYKLESEIGKKISYITYNVIKTKEPNEIINGIDTQIRKILGKLYIPYVIRLSELFNKNVLRDYLRFKEDFLIVNTRNYISIKTITNIEIARSLHPPALSALVADKLYELNDELINFDKNEMPNIEYTDITDLFYTKDSKDKTIFKKELINDAVIVPYTYKGMKIKLRMKLDTPPRNTLKRFEKKDVKVYLITKEHNAVIEYKTMVIVDGDYILNDNINSNKLIKRKK